MINRTDWIDQKALETYILNCQDDGSVGGEGGGIADKPGNQVDVFHTFFGLAALSQMDKIGDKNLDIIDPTYALPKSILTSKFPHLKL